MSKKGRDNNYVYIDTETIKRACDGDRYAQDKVVRRYLNYGRKCFRTIATTKYNLDMRCVPMDSLMQYVWIRLLDVIVKKFKV